jgi:hypothetical protein
VNRIVCLVILICGVACSKKDVDAPIINKQNPASGYKEYIIPKDQHYSHNNIPRVISKKEIRFMALFDSSCIYTSKNAENVSDINKLYGFSDCSSLHHQNSARIGWLWNGKAIALYAYCYIDNIRNSEFLGTVAPGTPVELSIGVQPGQYVFEFNGKKTMMKRSCSGEKIEGYQLYPYFGGDETAPHAMRVLIKDL